MLALWSQTYARSSNYRMMSRHLHELAGALPIHALNAPLLAGLVLGWKDRYARFTAYALRSRLTQFLRAAEAFGAPRGLHTQLPKLAFPRARQTIATPDELQRLLAHAQPWMRLYLLLCGNLGLRFSEAYSIAEQHWNQQKHLIRFRKKGGEEHELPITPEIEQLFQLAPEADASTPFFLRLRGAPLSPAGLRRHFHELKKKSGVNPKLIIHDLRRTVAVTAYELSKDIRTVSQILGHARISTTAWYLEHRDPEKIRELLQHLHMPTEVKQ